MAKRLNSMSDCRRFLARIANALDTDEIGTDKARAMGYLISIMQKILEAGDLEKRIEALEKQQEKKP